MAQHDAEPDVVRAGDVGGSHAAVLHVSTVTAVAVVIRAEDLRVRAVGDRIDRTRLNGILCRRGRHFGPVELLVQRASAGKAASRSSRLVWVRVHFTVVA